MLSIKHAAVSLSLLSQGKQQGPPLRFNCLLISFIEFNTRADRERAVHFLTLMAASARQAIAVPFLTLLST